MQGTLLYASIPHTTLYMCAFAYNRPYKNPRIPTFGLQYLTAREHIASRLSPFPVYLPVPLESRPSPEKMRVILLYACILLFSLYVHGFDQESSRREGAIVSSTTPQRPQRPQRSYPAPRTRTPYPVPIYTRKLHTIHVPMTPEDPRPR